LHLATVSNIIAMATKNGQPEKDEWWLNELESLGISVKKRNQLNDRQEISNLTENIKQTFFQDYKTFYNNKRHENIVV
jgi:hypothetical protein